MAVQFHKQLLGSWNIY